VGQGGAVLLQTQTHDLLFDTGPRQGASDAGTRTILPNLRALGLRKLDGLVVSHADSDHAGGLLAVLKGLSVVTLYSSFSFQEWLRRTVPANALVALKIEPTQTLFCERGQRWEWDGVVFQFLHPEVIQPAVMPTPAVQIDAPSTSFAYDLEPTAQSDLAKTVPVRSSKSRPSKNAQSCVLHVQGLHHSALLPGDIGVKQEQLLLEQYAAESPDSVKLNSVNPIAVVPQGLTADLVVVAHHGSDTSSSQRFVQQIRAQHAIAQVGYLNRFGHPHRTIQQRWLEAQTRFWQTDRHGAILANSAPEGLSVQPYSQLRQRYWHQRLR
jgi:competence protein ComEC